MSRSRSVVVVGSINVDYVMSVARAPVPGETVSDAVLELHPGGKGANQAVAVARCGAAVELVGCVGADSVGQSRVDSLAAEGVGTAYVQRAANALTGVAFIVLTPDGENAIIVAPGANAELKPMDVEEATAVLRDAKVLVAQLEVPIASVNRAAQLAGPDTVFVLNCAPYRPLSTELMKRVDILVGNETEAAGLVGRRVAGVSEATIAATELQELGARAVVITLGPDGAVVAAPDMTRHIPAPAAHVVDMTGAGDAFVGALAARLAAGDSLVEAVTYGTVVGSATTEQRGALPVVPVAAAQASLQQQPAEPGRE